MHNNVFMAMALCGCGFTIKAQRDNARVRYISTKTEKLDAAQKVKDCRDEKVTVEVSKTAISIAPANSPAETLTGNFTNVSCVWKEAFSKGKTIIDATLSDLKGAHKDATITIEGTDGTITILLEEKDLPGCVKRLLVEKHEEVN